MARVTATRKWEHSTTSYSIARLLRMARQVWANTDKATKDTSMSDRRELKNSREADSYDPVDPRAPTVIYWKSSEYVRTNKLTDHD